EQDDRDADREPCPDAQVLGWLQLEVGGAEIAQQVRAEVALLDDLVELSERGRLLDELGDALTTATDGLSFGSGCVALEALQRDAARAGQRDAQRDEDDGAGGESSDDECDWHLRDPNT